MKILKRLEQESQPHHGLISLEWKEWPEAKDGFPFDLFLLKAPTCGYL